MFLFIFISCSTTNNLPLPPAPIYKELKYQRLSDGGIYISETNVIALLDNIDELKAYNEKLRLLIQKLQK